MTSSATLGLIAEPVYAGGGSEGRQYIGIRILLIPSDKLNEGNLRENGYLLAHKVPLKTAKSKGSNNVHLFSFLMSTFLHWSVSLTLKAKLPSQAGNMAARNLGLTPWEFPYQKGTKGFFSHVPVLVPRKRLGLALFL